ncbi:MAG: hypothetical protein FH761_19225 [Firmicutes bacterium]|nr:hypothetical protein [Bacillota bacterium]
MSRIMETKYVENKNSKSKIEFETTGEGDWKVWDRYLTIDNKKAYHIGNVCGTCRFFFERMNGANQSISPKKTINMLNNGLDIIKSKVLKEVMTIIPEDNYFVNLMEINPKLVTLNTETDYFSNEQVKVWGIDGFWGFPHHPRISYYRGETKLIEKNKKLYEFIVPMFPQGWLDINTVKKYKEAINLGKKPTCIAISILDIKEHYAFENEEDLSAHWCLSHYIIDGHHKLFASYETGNPITMLSFVAVDKGISQLEDIKLLLEHI